MRSSPVVDAVAHLAHRGHHQALPQDRVDAQPRVGPLRRHDDQGQVEVAAEQVAHQVLGAALLDPQVDGGVRVAEPAQHRRGERGGQAGGGPEPDPAPAQPDQLLHLAGRGLHVGEDPGGQRQQHLAGRGERDVAPYPLEQRGPEVGLQGVNLLTERGLGDAHEVGGLGEMSYFGHRDEVPELMELHLHSLRLSTLRVRCIGRLIEVLLASVVW